MSIQTVNPYTNKVVKSFEEMTDKAVDTLIEKSEKTFNEWKETSRDYHPKDDKNLFDFSFLTLDRI